MNDRSSLQRPGRWVVKIGSAVLTQDGEGLDHGAVQRWVIEMVTLIERGYEIVLVSSGSVAEGISRLGWKQRPAEIHLLQAAASVGQMGLIQAWESQFQEFDRHTAQILLTHDDLADRTRYLNARSTLQSLLELNVIPVINENDTVVTDEIRFGDNDTLAALVANLVEADALVVLTDQEGLFDSDPRKNANATLIKSASANDAHLLQVAGEGSGLGRGGMITKVRAAKLAARSGTHTFIVSGRKEGQLLSISRGEDVGSFLSSGQERINARKQWLAGRLQVSGKLLLDEGAARVLRKGGKSLLPVGVTAVEGNFVRGDLVSCRDENGTELARGLVNYSSDEANKIIGCPTNEIADKLGYCDDEELVHRNNLVLV